MNLKSGELFQAFIKMKDVKIREGLKRDGTFLALNMGEGGSYAKERSSFTKLEKAVKENLP